MDNNTVVVGQPVGRIDGMDKIMGRAMFADDLSFPGMLHAKVLRGQVPHALLRGIDTSAAVHYPGVHAVLTYHDIPGQNRVGLFIKDEPVLVDEKMRRRGDALAVVTAETPQIAEQALALIEVDYEELEPVFDVQQAMEDHSPKVHGNTNILSHRQIRKGNVEAGLENSDMVVTHRYLTPLQEHTYLEPEAGVATYENGQLTLFVSTQNPHFDREEVARVLNLGLNQVRVVQAATGGGFGGKLDISVQCYIALLAMRTRRPVKLTYTREESIMVSPKRHAFIIDYTSGVDRNGKLQAVQVRLLVDAGAYASAGPGAITRAVGHVTGPYEVPHVSIDGYLVYTNNPLAGAMRGFGVPQVSFACEAQMDELSHRLQVNPLELRLKNALQNGSRTAAGQLLSASVGIRGTIIKAQTEARALIGPVGWLR